jgi:hypothetical protein
LEDDKMANYLEKKTILNDLEKFAEAITNRYEVMAVPCIDDNGNDVVDMGYFLYYRGRNAKLLMSYRRHETFDQFDQLGNSWDIVRNGTRSMTNYIRTIGDALKELGIKERKDANAS